MSRNQHHVAERGRDPDLRLHRGEGPIAPAEWGERVLDECAPIAAALDEAWGDDAHGRVLAAARSTLGDPESLSSTRVLHEVEHGHGKSFPGFALAQSQLHRRTLLERPLAADVEARFARLAEESAVKQREIEATDNVPFEAYRQQYLAQDLMSGAHFRATG